MNIDIRTLLLIGSLSWLARAGILGYLWHIDREYAPVRYWAIGAILTATGAVAFSLRGFAPDWLTVQVAHSLVMAGWVASAMGTVESTGTKPPWTAAISAGACGIAGLSYFVVISPDFVLRTLAVTIPQVCLDLYAGLVCWRYRTDFRKTTQRLLGTILLLSAASNAWKMQTMFSLQTQTLFESAPGYVQYFIYLLVGSIGFTAFCILLSAQELQKRLATAMSSQAAVSQQLESRLVEITDLQKQLQDWNKTLEEQVALRTARLRELSAELAMVEERERQVLAHELHDNLGQILAVVKIKLATLRPDSPQSLVSEIVDLLDQADQSARTITLQLNPPILRILDFPSALQSLADEMQRLHGLEVRIDDHCKSDLLVDELRAILYRCVRELLINVAKHGKTDEASITCTYDGLQLNIAVSDNGCGFEPASLGSPWRDWSRFGLRSVKERMLNVGGSMLIESGVGNGTTVSLVIPSPFVANDFPKR